MIDPETNRYNSPAGEHPKFPGSSTHPTRSDITSQKADSSPRKAVRISMSCGNLRHVRLDVVRLRSYIVVAVLLVTDMAFSWEKSNCFRMPNSIKYVEQ